MLVSVLLGLTDIFYLVVVEVSHILRAPHSHLRRQRSLVENRAVRTRSRCIPPTSEQAIWVGTADIPLNMIKRSKRQNAAWAEDHAV